MVSKMEMSARLAPKMGEDEEALRQDLSRQLESSLEVLANGEVIGAIGREEFVARYWRQQPLFLKGAANRIANGPLDEEMYLRWDTELSQRHPAAAGQRLGKAIFWQKLDFVEPALAATARSFGRWLGCDSVWFDGTLCEDGSSIGSHYDHSDNFVIQLQGRKIWNLHSPDSISEDELRRRMLNEPGLGSKKIAGDSLEFCLEPGDVLYIPMFWIHHGISQGSSLSLSMVCNPRRALDELMPAIRDALSHASEGWWRPLPLAEPQENGEKRLSREAVRSLLEVTASAQFRAVVEQEYGYLPADSGSPTSKAEPNSLADFFKALEAASK